jgi:hypothetical protein
LTPAISARSKMSPQKALPSPRGTL